MSLIICKLCLEESPELLPIETEHNGCNLRNTLENIAAAIIQSSINWKLICVCLRCADKIVELKRFYSLLCERLISLNAVVSQQTLIKLEILRAENNAVGQNASLHNESEFLNILEFDEQDEQQRLSSSPQQPLEFSANQCSDDNDNSSETDAVHMDIVARTEAKFKRKKRKIEQKRRILKKNAKADWTFHCELCSFETKFAVYYKKHLMQEHAMENPRIFKCSQCELSYPTNGSLKYHIKTIHLHMQARERKRNFLCTECGRSFTCNKTLRDHSATHTGEPHPFKCTEHACAKSYVSQAALNYHFQSAHSQQKNHICSICGASFALIFGLRTHMKKSHETEQKLCQNCGTTFKDLQRYEKHVAGEVCKNAIHPCEFLGCYKRFTRRRQMRRHMEQIHSVEL